MIKFITVSLLKATLEVKNLHGELLLLTYFVPPATPLPPPALEMDTQDAGVTLIRSIAKLKLLEFDACSFYIERASYLAKLNPLTTEFFCSHLAHFVKL